VTVARVYLDWNATTPPHGEVLEAMHRAQAEAWANPASVHALGRHASGIVEAARTAVASLTGFDARDVTFTSGGTEANNLALWHPFAEGRQARGGLVVSRVEHPSVTGPAQALARRGIALGWVEPEPGGRVTAEAVAAAMDRLGDVALVSVQAVNHETGVVHPIAAIAEVARTRGACLHVDAVQAVGKLPPEAWHGADLVTVAAHKMRGPRGIGAVATRPGVRLAPLLLGGAQERGARPGTQDASLAAGFRAAARRAEGGMPARYRALGPLRDALESALLDLGRELGIAVEVNGGAGRVAHVSNLSWAGWRGPELCAALDVEGVCCSSGAACSAGTAEPSPVITAMAGTARARSAIRLSLGEDSREEDVELALAAFRRVLQRTERAAG
jgi:cysteine desulfurase